MLAEQHFSNISRHQKPVNPEWAATVAKYLEEVGATDLDDPNAPRRKTPRTDAQLRELDGFERTKARNKARIEHQAALVRLEEGTAVLRQKKDRTTLAKKPKKQKKVAKTVKSTRVAKIGTAKNSALSKIYQAAKYRREALAADLSNGKLVKMIPQCRENNEYKDYQSQHNDLSIIKKMPGMNIVRLNHISTGESYFTLDSFKRHKKVEVTGNLIGPDREPLINALSSGKLFEASNVSKGKKAGSASVAQLVRRHGMDVYAVVKGRDLIGWITLGDVEVAPTEAEKRAEMTA